MAPVEFPTCKTTHSHPLPREKISPREIAKKGSEAEVLQVSYHIEGMSKPPRLLKILYLDTRDFGVVRMSNKFKCNYKGRRMAEAGVGNSD